MAQPDILVSASTAPRRKRPWAILSGLVLGAAAAWLMSGVQLNQKLKRLKVLDQQVVQLWGQGKIAEAIPLAQEALGLSEKVYANNPQKQASVILALARLHLTLKNFTQAEPLFKRNLEIAKKETGPERDANIAGSQVWLAECYRQERKFAAAEALLLEALTMTEKLFGASDQKTADVLAYLAAVYLAENRVVEADAAIDRALAISRQTYGPHRAELLPFLYYRTDILRHQQKYVEAAATAEQALRIEETISPAGDPRLDKLRRDILLMKANQTAPAKQKPLAPKKKGARG